MQCFWGWSGDIKYVLPEPQTDEEILCHVCDILSSRNDIDMQPPEYLKEVFEKLAQSKPQEENDLALRKAGLIELAKIKIGEGKDRDAIYEIIAKHNEGRKNPASIKDAGIINKIVEEMEKL